MNQLNNNTKKREFQHLNVEERKIIDRLLNENVSQAEIARILRRDKSTICREVRRGSVEQVKQRTYESKKADYQKHVYYKKYFADVGEKKYQQNRQNSGAKCKILENLSFVQFVEDKILSKEKWSPDAAIGYALSKNMFQTSISTKTFYNWVDAGLTKVKNIDLLLKVRRKAKSKIRQHKRILGKRIEERAKEADNRMVFGHWEGDGVVGKNHQGHLITLVERKTGAGFVFNVGDKQDIRMVDVLDGLQSKFGKYFSNIFKTIAFDNGSEFARSNELEKDNRTKVYYAHPYSSWERGTNENWNGILRRFIPKGTSFDNLAFEELERINMWINTLPRKRFAYRTPQDLFEQELGAIMAV